MKRALVVLTAGFLLAYPLIVHAADGGGTPARPESEESVAGQEQASSTSSASLLEEAWKSLSPGYYRQTPLPIQGRVMFYNPEVMDRVLNFRLQAGHVTICPDCVGYVAMLRRGDLDRRVWLQRDGKPIEGPFWVIDAADRRHVGGLLARRWVVDVDHETALRWRMNRPLPVTVWAEPPPGVPIMVAPTLAQRAAGSTEMRPLKIAGLPGISLTLARIKEDLPFHRAPRLAPPRLP